MKWRPIKLKTKISSRILALLIDNVGIYALIVGIFINIGKEYHYSLVITTSTVHRAICTFNYTLFHKKQRTYLLFISAGLILLLLQLLGQFSLYQNPTLIGPLLCFCKSEFAYIALSYSFQIMLGKT